MTYATLLVHLQSGRPNTALLAAAGQLADRFSSHVIGIAACQPMLVVSGDGTVCGDVFADDQRQIDVDLAAAQAEFHADLMGRGKSLEWRSRVVLSSISGYLAVEARCADLVMTGRMPADDFHLSRLADPGALAMEVGRPVFIVPPEAPAMAFGHALIGWKDTRECRRAAADALPLLKQTARVTVLEIATRDDLDAANERVGDVAAWLQRHGVAAGARVELAQGIDVDQLCRAVDDSDVDYVVAGAYGHSRLREWVLGGVTRDLLLGGSAQRAGVALKQPGDEGTLEAIDELGSPVPHAVLAPERQRKMHAYWRAANYLSVGQIYLKDNALLDEPLTRAHIKPRLLGHWGTTPGLNFVYVHLNRLIVDHDLDMIYVMGPGHGGPGVVAMTYLEGSYTERYPAIERNRSGIGRLFRQFSWPYGIPSHVAPETPGSIHEGGELGYSLAHAYGAAFDNPDLIVACVIGDGEAETGALATSWHSNKFIDPARDGAVLPILHLNGFKIANPTVLARIGTDELTSLLRGYGYEPHFVAGDDPDTMHPLLAGTLDTVLARIRDIQRDARSNPDKTPVRPRWPMIVLRTPKGWTGPKFVDGLPVEGTWRAHQVPIASFDDPRHVTQLEDWLRSYRPDELFDAQGRFVDDLAALAPTGHSRMGSNPHANGGELLKPLVMPHFRDYAVALPVPGGVQAEATRVLGKFLRDVMRLNLDRANFRVFGPDETASNRLEALFEVTGKTWMAEVEDVDVNLRPDGRVLEVLSEHLCEGWLEGYLLTGRHGLFSCYEAFTHIVDSMFNQHAKWLKASKRIPWRAPIASLNYLLTSHVWRQDHNGFSHQDPGFIDLVANKKADTVRIYLPPDANCLLSVADHCLRSRDYINVIVAGKQPEWQWLDIDAAVRHCSIGAGVWAWAGDDAEPDVVMACAGDVPTLETLAAVMLLRAAVPDIRIRVVNVVDLMVLEPQTEHPHGFEDHDFDALFTVDRPVVFAFHGYPSLIHKLTYRRRNHASFHVHGFIEEGTTTTPFDMVVLNRLDRFTLALDAIRRIPRLQHTVHAAEGHYWATLERHQRHIGEYGEDLPEIRDWRWSTR